MRPQSGQPAKWQKPQKKQHPLLQSQEPTKSLSLFSPQREAADTHTRRQKNTSGKAAQIFPIQAEKTTSSDHVARDDRHQAIRDVPAFANVMSSHGNKIPTARRLQ
jgi:hypothetical protein